MTKNLPTFLEDLPRIKNRLQEIISKGLLSSASQKYIVRQVRGRLKRFNSLLIVQSATKKQLLQKIRYYEIQFSAIDVWISVAVEGFPYSVITFLALGSLFIFSFMQTPIAAQAWLGTDYNVWSRGELVFPYFLGFCLAFSLFYLPFLILYIKFFRFLLKIFYRSPLKIKRLKIERQNVFGYFFPSFLILIGYALLAQYIVFQYAHRSASQLAYLILSSVLTVVFLIFSFFAFIFILSLTGVLLTYFTTSIFKIRQQRYPDGVLVHKLVEILFLLNKRQNWVSLKQRQSLLLLLEEIAVCISSDLPKRLQSGDINTDFWTKRRVNQMAEIIRSLKKWVVMPRADTHKQFANQIISILEYTTLGDWDGWQRLEKSQNEEQLETQRQAIPSLISLTITNIGHLIRAFLPILLILGAEQAKLWKSPTAEITTYLRGGALLWSIVYLLDTYDPRFRDRIALFWNIFQSLLPGGKK